MRLKELQSFITVVENKSFTIAAEKLFTSQPTISTHINALEAEFDTKLVARSTKQVEITEKGWELYETANNIFRLLENLENSWSNEARQTIHIGASTIPSTYLLPKLMVNYKKEHPSVQFTLSQGDSMDIIADMKKHLYDVGLIGMPYDDEQLKSIPFGKDRLVAITPATDHFKEMHHRQDFDIRELLKEPIVLRESGSASGRRTDHILDGLHLSEGDLNIVARVNSQEAIINLVYNGFGIAVLSERAAANYVGEGKVLQFELPEELSIRNLYLLVFKNILVEETLQAFIDYVLSTSDI